MVAKVAGGIIGLGLLGAGGIAVAKPHWFGMDYMPSWKPLSKDTNYSTVKDSDYGNGKFGNKKGNYLTGVIGNESWWEWSFRKLQGSNIESGKFKHKGESGDAVTKPHGGDSDSTALNQVCKAAYKTTSTDVVDTKDGDKFMKSEVWKYCSPLGKEPTTINDSEKRSYSGNIGDENNSGFISVNDEGNDMFWEIRDKEIKGADPNFEKITPSSAESYFTKSDKTLRELCEEAYGTQKTGGTGGKPTTETTKKYCVFEISNAS